jgi:hypothetical protein
VHSAAQDVKAAHVYFILTASEIAEIRMEGLIAPAQLDSLLNGLTPANGFTRLYTNADAAVYRVDPPPSHPAIALPSGVSR